ncbi:hypothetical protein HNQ94_000815 [Salirhabdus euzebyi]|uniref:Uncharacterized protein n=1 Tax=Salirhabdus euzebyi TaxID=394506 RepID=A0A841PU94_9BACI|nr:hypothetical protein [Salirhabdus euzebyi]
MKLEIREQALTNLRELIVNDKVLRIDAKYTGG